MSRNACAGALRCARGGVCCTSMTMAVSPSSMSAFARRISVRRHVGLLRKLHSERAATVSSLFSERSRICKAKTRSDCPGGGGGGIAV